jgi:UTP--glucose-1-phosphate uridylyltransferase
MSHKEKELRLPTKAIIPAAGLGTRFLPYTKAIPKEMLPIIDKPVIQLVVEDLIAAGVTDIIIVTGATKRAIEDHFDRSDALEADLIANDKASKAEVIREIGEMANFVYVRQKGLPKGNARPVLNARHLIDDDEPFFVLSADDLFSCKVPRAVQMLEAFKKTGKSVICLTEVDKEDSSKYGMVEVAKDLGDGLVKLKRVVEKPGPEKTPSTLATIMGYILTPNILPIIKQEKIGHSGEIVLADSINELLQTDEVYGQVIDGTYRDTGDPQKYLHSLVEMTLEHPKYGDDFREYLKEKVK